MNSSHRVYKWFVGTVITTCMFAIYYICTLKCSSFDNEVLELLQGRCDYEEAEFATWQSLGWPPPQSECFQVVALNVSGQNLTLHEWDKVARLEHLVVFRCHDSNIPAETLERICRKPTLHEVWIGPGVEEEVLVACFSNPNIYVIVVDHEIATLSLFQQLEKHIGAVFILEGDSLYRLSGPKIGLAGQYCFREVDWSRIIR